MTPFAELAFSREYWLTKIQNELYASVEQFLEQKGWTRTQFADHLGVTKGYVSQVLNGDFDHKLSKLIDLSLAVGVVPNIKFQEAEQYIADYLHSGKLFMDADRLASTISLDYTHSVYDLGPQQTNHFKTRVDNGLFISFGYDSLAA